MEVNWQTYEVYETLAEAKKEAKRNRGLWRIIQSKVVWQAEPQPKA